MASAAALSSHRPESVRQPDRPHEATTVHTRILRCMLAVDDSHAYWQRLDRVLPHGERARCAFEQRWFGTKSEARIRTLMTDMVERFDVYPEALALLQALGTVQAVFRPTICHIHTQLADPIYRRFTGEMLPERRERGQRSIDREVVAAWVDSLEPGRWSSITCTKFASNLLATAADAGLVLGKKDPRKLSVVSIPDMMIGYALYLLRGVQIKGTLDDNPYLRSLGLSCHTFGRLSARVPGLRIDELGGTLELTWLEPSLMDWGLRYLGGSA